MSSIARVNEAAIGAALDGGRWTDAELASLAGLRSLSHWHALEKLIARLQTQAVEVCLDEKTPHDVTQLHRGRISAFVDLVEVVERRAQAILDKRDRRGGGEGEKT